MSNNAKLEVAIADLFHSDGVPDIPADSFWFTRMLKVARSVGGMTLFLQTATR